MARRLGCRCGTCPAILDDYTSLWGLFSVLCAKCLRQVLSSTVDFIRRIVLRLAAPATHDTARVPGRRGGVAQYATVLLGRCDTWWARLAPCEVGREKPTLLKPPEGRSRKIDLSRFTFSARWEKCGLHAHADPRTSRRVRRSRGPVACGIDPIQCASAQARGTAHLSP